VGAFGVLNPGRRSHLEQHTRLRECSDEVLGAYNPTNPPPRKSPILSELSVANFCIGGIKQDFCKSVYDDNRVTVDILDISCGRDRLSYVCFIVVVNVP
jgi:hypothetical protein